MTSTQHQQENISEHIHRQHSLTMLAIRFGLPLRVLPCDAAMYQDHHTAITSTALPNTPPR